MMKILFHSVKLVGGMCRKMNSLWFVQYVVRFIFIKDAFRFDAENGNAISV
jgi:hypothetical protein